VLAINNTTNVIDAQFCNLGALPKSKKYFMKKKMISIYSDQWYNILLYLSTICNNVLARAITLSQNPMVIKIGVTMPIGYRELLVLSVL